MRSPTWHIAFQAAIRSESVSTHDRAAKIANDVVGDSHRRELDAAVERVVDLEHELAELRAERDAEDATAPAADELDPVSGAFDAVQV